jgi:predicted PurR-regulated permease PerM
MSDKSPTRYVFAAAAFVIVIAGMRAAQSLLVPFLLAAFLAVVLTPPLHWLERRRIPTPFALLIIVTILSLVGVAVFGIVGKSISDFSGRLPRYTDALRSQIAEVKGWAEREVSGFSGMDETELLPETENANETVDAPKTKTTAEGTNESLPIAKPSAEESTPPYGGRNDLKWLDPEWAMGVIKSITAELGNLLSNAMIILITVTFMLLEASRLPAKVRAAFGRQGTTHSHIDDIVDNIRRYMAIKTTTSLITAVLVTILVIAFGLDYPLLWGLMAFLFNYVPNIGSIIAAVPAVVLALVDRGLGVAMGTAVGYLAINCVIGYVIEPRFMGKGLGLSTLVVFVSLVFWGWVLGAVGMFLSAPLTMMVKIVLEDFNETRWIAILLSAKAPGDKSG